ncbi:type IV pilus modification PilV family protein [Desulfopila aestuarii]|nr:prepilin-type N-terminal cleavage/methylation domain-containing protein [Desulfopila aestuarii]
MPNNKGFTLIESVIAILLLTLMMLWTIQAMISAYGYASRNQLRDEAVRLSEELLTTERNTAYAALTPGITPTYTISRQIRNFDHAYSIDRTVTSEVPGLAYSVAINVGWTDKGKTYNYSATTIIGDK